MHVAHLFISSSYFNPFKGHDMSDEDELSDESNYDNAENYLLNISWKRDGQSQFSICDNPLLSPTSIERRLVTFIAGPKDNINLKKGLFRDNSYLLQKEFEEIFKRRYLEIRIEQLWKDWLFSAVIWTETYDPLLWSKNSSYQTMEGLLAGSREETKTFQCLRQFTTILES